MQRAIGKRIAALAVLAISTLTASTASAQFERYSVGMMQGSTIRDAVRNRGRDRDRHNRPVPGWTGGVQFIPGYGYDDCSPAIIVNSSPCYLPGYYAGINGYGGSGYGPYGYGSYSSGFQAGGIGLGYAQGNGYYGGTGFYGGYGQVLPAAGYARDDVREYAAPADQRYAPEENRRAPAVVPSRTSDQVNDYYLHRKPSAATKDPTLAAAIGDIEAAFRTGNTATLEKHVDRSGKLVLQVKGTTRQEMSAQDYLEMTRDALKVMKTARYELNKVQPASNGAVMVTGTHALRTEDGHEKTFTVGFILKQSSGQWLITEVSAEPAT